MPVNPNNAHSCDHHLILGGSGSGKTRWLTKLPAIKQSPRCFIWDPETDHRAIHCHNRNDFKRQTLAALQSGKPFRIAYVPARPTADEFDWFCGLVWQTLDGNIKTSLIVEEVADVTNSGKAAGYWGEILRKARKYYCTVYVISQRPQEVDKTTVSMCPFKWCGILNNQLDRKAVAGNFDLNPDDLKNMANEPRKKLFYWYKQDGPKPAELRHFNPK